MNRPIRKDTIRPLCRNRLDPDYSARDAIKDLNDAIARAEASRNQEPARRGRGSWEYPASGRNNKGQPPGLSFSYCTNRQVRG